jgi:PKD repeat protein
MLKPVIFLFCFILPLFTFTQTADFTFETSNGFFCNPATVVFTQNCTGNPVGFVWDFGNGEKGYSDQESITYMRAGTYRVTMVAIYPQKALRVVKTVLINRGVTASIGADKNYICQPGTVSFRAVTTGNVPNYTWDFGDTTGIVIAANRDTTHNYANFGDYTVTLKVTDTTGCEDTASTLIKVIKPPIDGSVTRRAGCVPASIAFTSTVTLPANDVVTSYNWDYGDGSPVTTTTTPNTSKLYSAAGTYRPTLNYCDQGRLL